MVLTAALGGNNTVEIVSLDSTPVPSCLTSLNQAVDLYEGCLTTLGGGNVYFLFVEVLTYRC